MNVSVTGGTGFIGQVLVRMLVERGDDVRVLVRKPEDHARIRAMGAVPVGGDLTRPGGCDGLVRAGDTVYHGAARVDMSGRWEEFAQTTIEGTRRLLEAALPARPARFVYISSAAVYLGKGVSGSVAADRTPANPFHYNLYAVAKIEAENLVRSECERAGVDWSIVRLGFLYGPGNRPLLARFVPLLERDLVFVIGDGTNRIATLYVDDAARAIVLAGTHPAAAGKIYDVTSDEHVTQREYLDATADAVGLPRPTRSAGHRIAYVGATLAELWARLVGGESPFNRAMVVLMGADQVVDSRRIRNELGWEPRMTFQEGMRRMKEWYHSQPAVRPNPT